MKRIALALSVLALFCFATGAMAVDKAAISKNVDEIVAGIESGTDAASFKADSVEPYAFIMQEDGQMLAHPSLTGKSLKEVAGPVYEALLQATPEGVWVEYEWKGKMKHTYAKKTSSNLIVGSGY